MRHARWHVSYIKLTRMSHRALYHYTTVNLCVYRRVKYASASFDLGGKKDKMKEVVPTFLLDHRCRHLEIERRLETKMARLPCCHDVTIGVSSSGLAPLLRRGAERWQVMPCSFLSVISRASLWDL